MGSWNTYCALCDGPARHSDPHTRSTGLAAAIRVSFSMRNNTSGLHGKSINNTPQRRNWRRASGRLQDVGAGGVDVQSYGQS
jgi:hypothetical protein